MLIHIHVMRIMRVVECSKEWKVKYVLANIVSIKASKGCIRYTFVF